MSMIHMSMIIMLMIIMLIMMSMIMLMIMSMPMIIIFFHYFLFFIIHLFYYILLYHYILLCKSRVRNRLLKFWYLIQKIEPISLRNAPMLIQTCSIDLGWSPALGALR